MPEDYVVLPITKPKINAVQNYCLYSTCRKHRVSTCTVDQRMTMMLQINIILLIIGVEECTKMRH